MSSMNMCPIPLSCSSPFSQLDDALYLLDYLKYILISFLPYYIQYILSILYSFYFRSLFSQLVVLLSAFSSALNIYFQNSMSYIIKPVYLVSCISYIHSPFCYAFQLLICASNLVPVSAAGRPKMFWCVVWCSLV